MLSIFVAIVEHNGKAFGFETQGVRGHRRCPACGTLQRGCRSNKTDTKVGKSVPERNCPRHPSRLALSFSHWRVFEVDMRRARALFHTLNGRRHPLQPRWIGVPRCTHTLLTSRVAPFEYFIYLSFLLVGPVKYIYILDIKLPFVDYPSEFRTRDVCQHFNKYQSLG